MSSTSSYPLVQLALDFPTIDQALRMAEIGARAGVDILEAGTPLIVAEGARAISRLSDAFPQYPILADYKTMDSGGKNVLLTQKQKGHYMTVCANATDETVRAAVKEGRATGIKVVVDTIGVKDQVSRSLACASWGVDWIYLHYAADQWRKDPSRNGTQWLESILEVVPIPVGIGTFGAADASLAASMGAQLVAIGHPLFDLPDFEDALKHYVSQVKSSYRPRPIQPQSAG